MRNAPKVRAITLNKLLEGHSSIIIKQSKEFIEILSGFETTNKYAILDQSGKKIAYMAEVSKGFWCYILRQLLKGARPIEIIVWNNDGKEILLFKSPFRWFFSQMTILAQGLKIGLLRYRFSLFHRFYEIESKGALLGQIKGSPVETMDILHFRPPWPGNWQNK